ncbi:MAG: PQQ-binding-like beta-propeller repeat protein [Planctomycetes bacterium]|nr:PQQ-binding-like beta-propeller repeat protein [Planctomycetota bacterium]
MCSEKKILFVLALILLIVSSAFCGDWMQWRGPNFNGSAEATGLVGDWSVKKNVKWSTKLPGTGASTPIVCKGRVFISSTDKASKDLLGMCFDAATGKELWRKKITTASRKIARKGDMACPSASTDGDRVYFTFENGVIAALDLDGNLKWQRQLEDQYGSVHIKFGYSSTPLLFDGRMYVLVLRHPDQHLGEDGKPRDSFILAIDPVTGKNIFKQPRQFKALEETYDSYTSAIPFVHGGRKLILVNAADNLSAHDPATGKEIWRYKYCLKPIRWGRNIASVVTGDGKVFGARARGDGFYAINGGAKGLVEEKDVAWTFDGPAPDVSTPLYYRGNLYVLAGSSKKVVSCLESKTGKVKWTTKLGGSDPWRASMTAGDGKIYCINEGGLVVTFQAGGDKYKEISRINLDDKKSLASISIADKAIFIRTGSKLYRIQK